MPKPKSGGFGLPGKKELSPKQCQELLTALKTRFEKNPNRHKDLEWVKVQSRLEANPEKLWSLNEMERTGGEPDVVGQDKKSGEFIFYDCSAQSPEGRTSLCYDRAALDSRKEHKPKNSATDTAAAMGIEVLTEEQYFELQKLRKFDTKSSSWIKTPAGIRKLCGAHFGERRFGCLSVFRVSQRHGILLRRRGFRDTHQKKITVDRSGRCVYIHKKMKQELNFGSMENCVCSNLRSVTRAVTQFFDAEVRQHGLRPTQTPILGALQAKDGWGMAELSDWLGMERTTLLRNLRPLQRDGLVRTKGGGRGGHVELEITERGRKALARLLPAWRSAQDKVVAILGKDRWSTIISDLEDVSAQLKG